jgi:hypothetical protein
MGIRATILSRAPVMLELLVPPGGSSPLHVHVDDEDTGVIVDGVLKTWCDGEIFDLGAGSCVSLPRNRPHAQLAVGTTPARVIAVYNNSHFADFIAAVGIPADRPPPPPGPPPPSELARLREIAAAHQLQILGPAPAELLAFRG